MTFFGCKRGVVVVSQFAGAVLRSWSTPRVGILRQAAFALFACAFATTTFATVGINKSFTPNSVSAGQVSTLTIVLLNPNATPATGIDFTDFLPANVVVATPLTFSTLPLNCVDTSLLAAGATSIHFPNGTIPAISGGVPGQCQVTVNVVSILPNTYLNTIPNNAVTSSNGSNPQDAQATLVVSALVNVTGAKAFLPTTVHGNGAPSTLTITLTNPNVVPLNLSAAFTDTLPANVTIATPSNVVTTCPLGTATASAPATNPSTVTLATGAQIPASGSCTIKVDVIARNPNAAVNAASTNTIAAGALKTLEGVTSPAITANVTVQTGGAITKAFSPATIPVGGTTPSTLTITITNFNDSILTPITFTDNLPAGMTVTGVPASTCIGALTNTLTSVTLTGASLAAFSTPVAGNKSCTITLQVFATSTRNNSIAAGNWGGVAYSGTGNVSLTVRTIGGSKAFSAAVQNGTTTMTITLQNSASSAAAITSLTDLISTLGAGFTFAAAPTIGGTCGSVLSTSTATSFVVTGGSIPAAVGPVLGSCTITVGPISISTAATVATHTNTIAVNGVVTSLGNNAATITGNVAVGRALTVSKAFNPTTVQAGTKSRLTVTLTRAATASDLTGIGLTDNLTSTMGAGFVVATPPNAATTCTGATFSPVLAGGEAAFTVAGGSLANANPPPTNFSCTISVDVATTGASVGAHTNAIPGANVTTAQAVTLNDTTAVLTINNSTVTVNKSFSPTTVAVGAATFSTMTLQIRNNNAGAITLTGAGLVDNLPVGMVFATVPTPTLNGCGAATLTPSAVAPWKLTLANATVNAAAICTATIRVSAMVSGNLINNIPPGTVTSAQGVTNPLQGTATLAATGTVKLTVTKTNGVSSITPGGTTTYTMGVSNAGPNDVAGLLVNDTPPAGVTFGTWTCLPTGGAICGTGSGPIADIVTIPNGGSITYTVPATIAPNVIGTLTNTINVVVPGSVINTGGTTASDSDPAVPVTNLAITKSDGSTTFLPGGNATYVMVLTNGGPSDASNVAIADTLPPGVTQNGPASCIPAGAGALCGAISNLGTGFSVSGAYVPAGGGASLSYSLPVDFGAGMSAPSITNTVTATNAASSGPGSSASASDTNTIVLFTPTLGKSIVPGTIAAGGTATLTLVLGNPNAGATSLTALFIDNMPAGITTTSGNTGSCTGVTVTAASISKASGSILPSGGCTIIVTITSTTPGTATNTTGSLQTVVGTAPPASAPLTVNAAALTLTKTILPANIVAGGTSTLTLTLGNSNATAQLLTAAFTDPMPGGVTTTGGNTGTCTGVIVASALITVPSGTSIPSGGCSIIVTITSSTPGLVTNTTSTLATGSGTAPPASAPLTVNASAPTLTKTILPAIIVASGTSTLTLTLGNSNATAQLLTAPFTDPMPAGVTTTSGNTGTCTGVTVVSALITVPSGTSIPSGGCSIIVTITSSTPGLVTNTTSTLDTIGGIAPPASAPLTVNAAALSLTKTISPATIVTGGTATLTLTLGNSNAVAQLLTSPFMDAMPAGVTTTSGNTGTCTGVVVTPTLITLPSGSSIPAGSCTIIVTITSSTPGSVTNTTSALVTPGGTAPPASAPLTVSAAALTLTKTISPATIVAGGTSTLTLTLGNSNAVAQLLTAPFTDPMPAGVTTTSANTGTCAGVTVAPALITMASASSIPPGGCTIVVTITSSTPGTVTNTTSLVVTTGGTAPAASAPLTVTPSASALTKTILPATITAGGTATLTLSLANANATPQVLVAAFTDAMPAGLTTTSGNTGTCTGVTVAPTLVTMASGSAIPPGGCTIIVTITSTTPGAVINTTSTLVTSGGTTPPASAPLTVNAGTSALAKTIVPATIAVGGTSTLTLTLGNPNAVAQALTAPFTDPMPAGVTTTSGNTGTCTGITVAPALITMASGSPIPPGGCTIIVTITSTTPGTVTNTTSTLVTAGGITPAASAPLTVTAVSLTLTKTISPATIVAGGPSTLTLTLGNPNAIAQALTAPFTDPMPAGVTTTSNNAGTCTGVTVTSTMITLSSGASIPPGGCTIVVSITSSTPGTVTNTTSSMTTSAGTTPPASAPLTVTATGSALTKVMLPTNIPTGGTSTLTLALANANATPLLLTASFNDPMPSGVTTTSGNSGTCTGVTVTPTLISMASGSSIPPGGCSIVVTITSYTLGAVTNTTGVLTTNGGVTAPATAPLIVRQGPTAVIPANTPMGLLLLLLALTAVAGWHLRARAASPARGRE